MPGVTPTENLLFTLRRVGVFACGFPERDSAALHYCDGPGRQP